MRPSLFGRGWRQFTRGASGFETHFAMRAVAKGLVFGVPAAAQADGLTPSEAEDVSFGVLNREISLNTERAIVVDRDLR